MTQDAAVPVGFDPAPTTVEQGGVYYTAARWTPEELVALARHLRSAGRRSLAEISDDTLMTAWSETVTAFLDPCSPERTALDPMLAQLCRLSRPGLEAALEAVLGGVAAGPAVELREAVRRQRPSTDPEALALVVLAANVPALALQPLLPGVSVRIPTCCLISWSSFPTW